MDNLVYIEFTVQRVYCKTCGTSHALLPDTIIPYFTYSYSVVLFALAMIYVEHREIQEVCEYFDHKIPRQLIKQWCKRFDRQYILMAIVQRVREKTKAGVITNLISSSTRMQLQRFHEEHQHCFLHIPITSKIINSS
ncbi:DUF6431 domain-containing protein [Breznakia blatticola]|nr:DUF6431 domain-containing protein [Breznakia blatticola]